MGAPSGKKNHNLPQPTEVEKRLDMTTNLEKSNRKRDEVSPKLCFAVVFHFHPKSHAWFLLSV
jgi:hypothetical protein